MRIYLYRKQKSMYSKYNHMFLYFVTSCINHRDEIRSKLVYLGIKSVFSTELRVTRRKSFKSAKLSKSSCTLAFNNLLNSQKSIRIKFGEYWDCLMQRTDFSSRNFVKRRETCGRALSWIRQPVHQPIGSREWTNLECMLFRKGIYRSPVTDSSGAMISKREMTTETLLFRDLGIRHEQRLLKHFKLCAQNPEKCLATVQFSSLKGDCRFQWSSSPNQCFHQWQRRRVYRIDFHHQSLIVGPRWILWKCVTRSIFSELCYPIRVAADHELHLRCIGCSACAKSKKRKGSLKTCASVMMEWKEWDSVVPEQWRRGVKSGHWVMCADCRYTAV